MALGIRKTSEHGIEITIPLRGHEMEGNDWLIEHLRQLAQFIERHEPSIMHQGVICGQYGPQLIFICYENNDPSKRYFK